MGSQLKSDVKKLWVDVFHDDARFVDFYFDRIYRDEYVRCTYDGLRLVCALQLLPYRYKIGDILLGASYVGGVCTDSDYRGRHFMSELIKAAVTESPADLMVLMPADNWLFGYYRRFGFAPVFRRNTRWFENTAGLRPDSIVAMTDDELLRFVCERESERNSAMIHSVDDFMAVFQEIELSGGKVVSHKEDNFRLVCFCYPENGSIIVRDYFTTSDETAQSRMKEILFRAYPHASIGIRQPGGPERYGMARIIDAYSFVLAFARANRHVETAFSVTDDLILRNNASFEIKEGLAVRIESSPDLPVFSISSLAEYLFCSSDGTCRSDFLPWISLLLE